MSCKLGCAGGDCQLEIGEPSSNCYIHLCLNTFGKAMNALLLPSYGLNSKICNISKSLSPKFNTILNYFMALNNL